MSEPDITVARAELPPLEALQAEWLELEARSRGSFFQSWSWIGTWLALLPGEVPRWLLRAQRGPSVVGLAVVCENTLRRHGVLSSRALFLNCTGRADLDELTVEYNGFLAEQGLEAQVTRQCVEFLRAEREWDELYLNGWHRLDLLASLGLDGLRPLTVARRPCRYVDLQALRESGADYAENLPKTARYNLRRSIRDYAKLGELKFEVARTAQEALEFLDGLKRLHQQSWQAKGQPGSFANAFFDRFHRELVGEQFASGVIQLARLRVGVRPVGFLYNFVHRGHVYHYQSGLDFDLDSRLSPGLVCNANAVAFNREAGHALYDFMAGEQGYKKDLASHSTEMLWLVLQQRRLKFQVEGWLRAGKARLQRRPGVAGHA